MAKFLVKKMYNKVKVKKSWFSYDYDEYHCLVDIWIRSLDWEKRTFIKTISGKMGGEHFNSSYTFEVDECPEGTLEFDAPEYAVLDIQRVG